MRTCYYLVTCEPEADGSRLEGAVGSNATKNSRPDLSRATDDRRPVGGVSEAVTLRRHEALARASASRNSHRHPRRAAQVEFAQPGPASGRLPPLDQSARGALVGR